MAKLACVLFDLDGTLVDSAPDLIACLNQTLSRYGFETVTSTMVKPAISHGALAMLNASLKPSVSNALRQEMLKMMLALYENNIAEQTVFFPGMMETLVAIEAHSLLWGIVTNKRERFTQPLIAALQLNERVACVISGDTTAYAKPHSAPMLEACKRASVPPEACVFIGDAQHDITAGKNANMRTLVATYGYLNASDTPETWGADDLIASPEQLTRWINTALCH